MKTNNSEQGTKAEGNEKNSGSKKQVLKIGEGQLLEKNQKNQ